VPADPQAAVWELLYGRWKSQALYAGVKLGIFDAIGDAPRSTAEVGDRLSLDPALLYRLMRALASIALLEEHAGRSFSIAPAGAFLCRSHPRSLRDIVLLREGPEHSAVWKHLAPIVADGIQNGFVREFGSPAYEYARRTPAYAAAFDAAMSSYSRFQTDWTLDLLEQRDLTAMAGFCDVGGGQGHLLAHLLRRYERAWGTVLERAGAFDEPGMRWADRLGVSERCRYLTGDMFADVPPADGYFLKMILHNWSDDECVRVLRAVRSGAPPSARVFIIEHVVPDIRTPHFAKLFDLHMLCWGSGRERTAEEFAALLDAAGWTYVGFWPSPDGPIGIVEGA
jgi:hypothetical protein